MDETLLYGEPLEKFPEGLFIPPDALKVFLESFQGPLDLLLYLIKKQNFDILDIPISEITSQYLTYIDQIKGKNLELAAEYLLMAAILVDIKTRMLLPKPVLENLENGEEIDPRAKLAKQLLEYEKFKVAAQKIELMPRIGRDWSVTAVHHEYLSSERALSLNPSDILLALQRAINDNEKLKAHKIATESLSVREFMSYILKHLSENGNVVLDRVPLISGTKKKAKLIVIFLAILELAKEGSIEISQSSFNGPIWILKNK